MAAEKIGDARCPLCSGTARVSLSKSGYAVLTCNGCNVQLFTRSPRSDELVRDLIRPAGCTKEPQPSNTQGVAPQKPAPMLASAPKAQGQAQPLAPPPIATPPTAARESAGFGLLTSGWFK